MTSLTASCILPAHEAQAALILPLRWNERDARYSFQDIGDPRLGMRFNGLQAYTMTLLNFDKGLTSHVDSTQHPNLEACTIALRQRVAELGVSLALGSRGFCTDNLRDNGPMPERYVRTSTGAMVPYR